MPARTNIAHARQPLTYSTGTTPGEQEISSQTTAPTLATHGFELGGIDAGAGNLQYAAPRFIDLIVELENDGASPDDLVENFSIWFYFPDAATTNKWRETAAFQANGVNKRGAVGADAGLDPAGNIYKIDVPQAASRAFVHFATLTASIKVHVLAYPDS